MHVARAPPPTGPNTTSHGYLQHTLLIEDVLAPPTELRATGWALRVLQADRVTEEPGQLYAHPAAATGSTCVAPAPLAALGAAVAPPLVLVDDAMLTLSLETQNAWLGLGLGLGLVRVRVRVRLGVRVRVRVRVSPNPNPNPNPNQAGRRPTERDAAE